jgi:hypothetical protein
MKAFPLSNMTGLNQQGMDLRDYFAAKCIPIVQRMIEHNHNRDFNGNFEWEYDEEDFEVMAGMAYGIADAMMKARNETP